MSSDLKYKMQKMECAPPEGLWEKIAAELDQSDLASTYPAKLYNASVTPPANAWQSIAAALDDVSVSNQIGTRLAALEIVPPQGMWQQIEAALDDEPASLTKKRSIAPFIRYAAAAVVLAFMAWGGINLINNSKNISADSDQGSVAKKSSGPDNVNTDVLKEVMIGSNGMIASMEEARNDAALEASKQTYAKLDISTTSRKLKNAASFAFITDDDVPQVHTRGLGDAPTYTTDVNDLDLTKRYIVLMTPDGNIIRMSKKLKDLVCCVSGEDEDKDCIDQMKRWRDKIANPAITHSPGNFMDIMSMIGSLQDN